MIDPAVKAFLEHIQTPQYKQNCRARKSPLTRKDRELRKKYGISEAEYDHMFAYQQGQCGICKTHQSKLTRSLAVDHCHDTGRVRGLLCSACNTAIGLLRDSKELMARASRWVMTDAELGISDEQAV